MELFTTSRLAPLASFSLLCADSVRKRNRLKKEPASSESHNGRQKVKFASMENKKAKPRSESWTVLIVLTWGQPWLVIPCWPIPHSVRRCCCFFFFFQNVNLDAFSFSSHWRPLYSPWYVISHIFTLFAPSYSSSPFISSLCGCKISERPQSAVLLKRKAGGHLTAVISVKWSVHMVYSGMEACLVGLQKIEK